MEGDLSKPFTIRESNVLCAVCKKLLNVAPISYSEEIGKICGRCYQNPDYTLVRQYCFEDIIKDLIFPCSNKTFGCNSSLKWGEVLDHEKTCTYQLSSCPAVQCNWNGNAKQLTPHIESMHKVAIMDPLIVMFSELKLPTQTFFTHVSNVIVTVVVQKDADHSKHFCYLMINGTDLESQCFRYQLELFDETKSNSLILRKNRLYPLGSMLENLKCNNKMLEIDLDKVKGMLGNATEVTAKFGIVKKTKKEIMQIMGDKECELLPGPIPTNKEAICLPDESMLLCLECPVCNEYMRPPIYVCQTGHSVCSDCKSKVGNCPTCRIAYTGARNFTLESITAKVNYPCKNREIGCSYVCTLDKMRQHEGICELAENDCILRCGWKGLSPSMYYHVLEKHPLALIEQDTVIMHDVKKTTTHHALYVMGELFRFTLKANSSSAFEFNLQHLAMIEKEPKFKYQMQFVDEGPLGLNMSFTNTCQVMTPTTCEALKNGIILPYKLVKPFVFEKRYFYFKLFVTKI